MSAIDVPREYADGEILLGADLDAFLDAIETFLNITKLNDDNLQNGGITGSLKLVNASVTNAKLAADAVDTTQVVNDSITRDKIAPNVAGTGLAQNVNGSLEITTSGVATAMIADLAVTTAKINAGAVTQVKRAALAPQISSSSGTSHSTSTSFADITNLTVTITTTGRPVYIGMMSSGSTSISTIFGSSSTSGLEIIASFQLLRDGTVIAQHRLRTAAISSGGSEIDVPPSSFWMIDDIAAGTYVYKVQYKVSSASATVGADNVKLIAYEL